MDAGDSRAVIQRNGEAEALTRDHKPEREDEAVRAWQDGMACDGPSDHSVVQHLLIDPFWVLHTCRLASRLQAAESCTTAAATV